MTCFAAVDLGGQSGRVVLGRVHRQRLSYREVHRFANVPRVVPADSVVPGDNGTRWHWDTEALWEETLEGLAAAAATSSAGRDGVVSCGSWALAGCIAARPALDERARYAGYTNESSADGRTLLLRNLSGLWLLESCLTAWVSGRDRSRQRAQLLAAAAALPAGGPARSTAQATGLPVVAGPAEATSIGNLMVQAVAAGTFDSLDSARAAVQHGGHGPVLEEPAC